MITLPRRNVISAIWSFMIYELVSFTTSSKSFYFGALSSRSYCDKLRETWFLYLDCFQEGKLLWCGAMAVGAFEDVERKINLRKQYVALYVRTYVQSCSIEEYAALFYRRFYTWSEL